MHDHEGFCYMFPSVGCSNEIPLHLFPMLGQIYFSYERVLQSKRSWGQDAMLPGLLAYILSQQSPS